MNGRNFHPSDVGCEKATVGCALNDPQAATYVATLPETYFTADSTKALHQAIRAADRDGVWPDMVAVVQYLKSAGKLATSIDSRDGVSSSDLAECAEAGIIPAQVKEYVRFLADLALQREVISKAHTILDRATQRTLAPDELRNLVDDFQQKAFAMTTLRRRDREGLRPAGNAIDAALQAIEAREEGGRPSGILTPFSELNRAIGGFQEGELGLVGARPSQGKTAFLLDLAVHGAEQAPVCLFSLEMDRLAIGQRLLAKGTGVDLRSLRGDSFTQAGLERISGAGKNSRLSNLFIDDTGDLSPFAIRARTRELSQRLGRRVGLVLVDYLQLLHPGRRFDNREREVATISRDLKLIAKDLSAPVIVAAQLNRALENRKDKRPVLSDLRESGALEMDADLVIALHLPFAYSGAESDRGKAEAIILKQRNGPIGSLELRWIPHIATFVDPAAEEADTAAQGPGDCPSCDQHQQGWCRSAMTKVGELATCPQETI